METMSRRNPEKIQRRYWACRCDPETTKALGDWANDINARFSRTGPERLTERSILELLVRHTSSQIARSQFKIEDLLAYEQDDD